MKLIIGCPIYKRNWIFPFWAACLERQSIDLSEIGFLFETSPDDKASEEILRFWRKAHSNIPLFEINERSDIPHFEHQPNSRQWTYSKYHNMVSLRNSLLERVREIQPDYYLSLDSDILLRNPSTLELLMNHIDDGADAVSPLMYMTPVGTDFPSVMTWREDGRAQRTRNYPIGTYFKADIIMAAKMMSQKTYNTINYEFHPQGEDLGWSKQAKDNNLSLYSASYIYAAHIMHENLLETYVTKGDPRELQLLKTI